jgi:hypothetical protein
MKSWNDEAQRLAWWWPHLKHIKDLNEIIREMVAEIIESGKLRCPDPSKIRNGSGVVRADQVRSCVVQHDGEQVCARGADHPQQSRTRVELGQPSGDPQDLR